MDRNFITLYGLILITIFSILHFPFEATIKFEQETNPDLQTQIDSLKVVVEKQQMDINWHKALLNNKIKNK